MLRLLVRSVVSSVSSKKPLLTRHASLLQQARNLRHPINITATTTPPPTTTRYLSSSSQPTKDGGCNNDDALSKLPDETNIIIIGGGIIGTSVAYHLGKLGAGSESNLNVILLEKHTLTSGTTWHAAGLMTSFGSMSSTSMELRTYTKELYSKILPQETNLETGFMDVGFIELATENDNNKTKKNPNEGIDRLQYYRRVKTFNQYCNEDLTVEEITPQQIHELFPQINCEGILAGFYVPTDGRVNPTDVTMSLAKGARQYNNVKIYEGISVDNILVSSKDNDSGSSSVRKVTGVKVSSTKDGNDGTSNSSSKIIKADIVVNCAGMWARQLSDIITNDADSGKKSKIPGISVPNQAAEHYYLITDDIPGLNVRAPVIEDASKCIYLRPEGKGLLIGFFETIGAPCFMMDKNENDNDKNNQNENAQYIDDDGNTLLFKNTDSVPNHFHFGELQPDWDRMTPYVETALQRLDAELRDTIGIKKFFCGPESFTPDGCPILGPLPSIPNMYVAAGLNSIGILTGGGVGRTIAQWILNKGISPSNVDVTGVHVNRFHNYQMNYKYRQERVKETLGNTYKLLYPDHQPHTCRNVKRSILHDRLLKDQHAHFRDVSGWESPAYYANPDNVYISPFVRDESFGRCSWFPFWEEEHLACRNNVALFDMSFMSKFLVQGRDAGTFLNRISTANVNGDCNLITYTQWLNENGYLEADLTVTKLNDDEFMVVATDTMHNHVLAHMNQRIRRDEHVFVTDVTGKYAQINLQGPKSRDLLQKLTNRNMMVQYDFRTAEEIEIGMARVLCMRITYVGELGYELFIPAEQAIHVYDQILEAGHEFGLKHAGLKALGSLRMEKGYRDYGHDIDNTDTIVEAGLSFTCDFEKEGGFIGQDHVLAEKARNKERGGMTRRMASVLVPLSEEDPLLYHGEVIWRNGERISDIRAGSYGHTVGGGVGLTMLESRGGEPINKAYIENGTWEVEIADQRYPCQVKLAPFYDPKNSRIKV